MADTKITALAAIGANPINVATFPIPMVDLLDTSMAASGTTKKVTVNQILGAGGTATLASATISGDLTVDTNTLKVDSANNRVGIGTATPAAALAINLPEVSSAAGTSAIIYNNTGGGNRIAALRLQNLTNQWNIRAYGSGADDLRFGSGAAGSEVDYLSIGNTGIFTWSNVGGVAGTAMTLNSTGLGVGASPSYNLDVRAAAAVANVQSSTGTNAVSIVARNTGGSFTIGKENSVGGGSGVFGQDAYASVIWSTGAYPIAFGTNGSQRVVVKSTGQVKFTPLSADPSGAEAGDVYYNSTSNKLKCYNGTTWNDLF